MGIFGDFNEDFCYFCNVKATIMKKLLFFCATLFCLSTADAKITMPQLFQSGMVMQRGKAIPVWGKADAGETITIRFNKKEYTTTADANGRWRIDLPKMKAGGPYQMSVNEQTIDNIMIGDVWLLSGQSNIDVHIERVYPQYTTEVDNYENTNIRLFRVQNETSTHGVKDDIRPTSINWKPLNKQNAWPFSAVGYFLGKKMFEKNKVAQGIIVNSWGGTPIEAWISEDSLKADYPMLIKKTQMYQSDNYVRAQMQANGAASQQWDAILNQNDPGYANAACDDSQWTTVNQNN
jgi:sialate O-acetylesterase